MAKEPFSRIFPPPVFHPSSSALLGLATGCAWAFPPAGKPLPPCLSPAQLAAWIPHCLPTSQAPLSCTSAKHAAVPCGLCPQPAWPIFPRNRFQQSYRGMGIFFLGPMGAHAFFWDPPATQRSWRKLSIWVNLKLCFLHITQVTADI